MLPHFSLFIPLLIPSFTSSLTPYPRPAPPALHTLLRAQQNLRAFPIDTQTLNFTFHNINVPETAMTFKLAARGDQTLADPEGYILESISSSVVSTTFSKNQFSGVSVQYKIARIADIYIFRFVVPLVIITILVLSLQFANTSSRTMR